MVLYNPLIFFLSQYGRYNTGLGCDVKYRENSVVQISKIFSQNERLHLIGEKSEKRPLFFIQGDVVIRPITFRSDWSCFMNFRVIGLIEVVPASKFRSDWSDKSQISEYDLLQKLKNLT